jgi:YHS domain-containing protein
VCQSISDFRFTFRPSVRTVGQRKETMMTFSKTAGTLSVGLGLAALVAWTAGCSTKQPTKKATATAAAAPEQAATATEHADATAMEQTSADDAAKIKASFASLSPADRELAMKQKVCPVSGELLGLMATPIKVDVEGQTVFICCPSCKEPLLDKPDEYLVKLGLKPSTE